ncbi:YhdP family protein [Pararhizobium haloflavum]|uniref:YhdP family protein n=1 Tax=Pararhizobium haloflavum TaxID=2037914 RepID=UPI000DEEA3BD|nr:AsmA-like C-terminal region-containing protein [Pararhizobium haloflavum]
MNQKDDASPSADAPYRPASDRQRGVRAKRTRFRRVLGFLGATVGAAFVIVILAFSAVQFGLADGLFANRIRAVLAATVGPDMTATVDSASIRIGRDGRLAIEADAVRFRRSGRPGTSAPGEDDLLTSARSVRLLLDPLPVLNGRLNVESVVIDGATFDPTVIGNGGRLDWSRIRVDALEEASRFAFEGLDRAFRMLDRSGTSAIRFTDGAVVGAGAERADGSRGPLRIETVELALSAQDDLTIEGTISFGDQTLTVNGETAPHRELETLEDLNIRIAGLTALGNRPFFAVTADAPELESRRRFGVESEASIALTAHRTPQPGRAMIAMTLDLAPGVATLGGNRSVLKQSRLRAEYLPDEDKIEILPSTLHVGQSRFPFSGGIIDISNLNSVEGRGFAIELLVDEGRSAPTDSSEPALTFDGKVFARFLKHHQRLVMDEITLASPFGQIFASAGVGFGGKSPEVSLAASFARMGTGGLKQLWPHWIAKRPRQWVLANLFGGHVENGELRLFIPQDRMAEQRGRLQLDDSQLRFGFDLRGARVGIAGDLPPLREANGRFDLMGNALTVAIDRAKTYFASDRDVDVESGTFTIAETDRKPLMADLELSLAGSADAVAEIISYRPIDVIDRIGYRPEDFSGTIKADVSARFGLIAEQGPPPPEWSAELDLADVDIAKPVEGRRLEGMTGTLAVKPSHAVLQADAAVDGVPMTLQVTQPLQAGAGIEAERLITAQLDDAARAQLVPGLGGMLSGVADLSLSQIGKAPMEIAVDLTSSALTVPGLNWTKAAGIPAEATFTAAVEETGIRIDAFEFAGDGFGVSGAMDLVDGRLASARFDRVRLSQADEYSARLTNDGDGYRVEIDGETIDLRSIVGSIRSGATGSSTGEGVSEGAAIDVTANVAQAVGFNGEVLSNLTASYSGRNGEVRSLDVKGVTGSGEALVLSIDPVEGGSQLQLNSGDAGAAARFADLYGRIDGGLINLQLTRSGKGPYAGRVTMDNFSVIDEAQLQQIVTARAYGAEQSLNDAVQGRINTEAAQFERGFARIRIGDGSVTVSDGVVRGPQIGTTFQGTVRDPNGQMAITGTFMPAYGLNRLFAEIPLFGALLGNGRDRGLIGITFRLAGPSADPQLTVNPISVMAPGIFRQIFEF